MFLERYREALSKAFFILRFTENFAILVSRASTPSPSTPRLCLRDLGLARRATHRVWAGLKLAAHSSGALPELHSHAD